MRWKLALLAALIVPAPALAETFDLDVYTYCPGLTTCDFGSYKEFRKSVLDAIEEVNLEWGMNGITFRPNAIFIPVPNPDYEAARCEDDPDTEGVNEAALFRHWRQNVAMHHPDRISILLNWVPGGKGRMCCSELPINTGEPADAYYGILCDLNRSTFDLGTVLAHELGHHFCLCHTFGFSRGTKTFMDVEDWSASQDGALDWSGDDDGACGVSDTDPDPAWLEQYDANGPTVPLAGLDLDDTELRDGHQWCNVSQLSASQPVDPGSPHTAHCSLSCAEHDNDQTFPWSPPGGVARATQNAMGYWGADCRGPYVRNGQNHPAFSLGQRARARSCYETYRADELVDVCAARGGDADGDGVCQLDDKCKQDFDTHNLDSDGDGFGDPCDPAQLNPGVPVDVDLDAIDAIADQDDDGDGCPDVVDQHPNHSMVIVGTTFASSCGYGTKPDYGFEGNDSDGDGVLDCRDVDDDNDGVCDDGGPFDALAPGALPQGCARAYLGADLCPTAPSLDCFVSGPNPLCPPGWVLCNGAGCGDYFLKLISLSDPDGGAVVEFDRFQQFNDALYLSPLSGCTPSQWARVLAGEFGAAGLPFADATDLRLELWRRTRDGDASFAALVAEYNVADVEVGDLAAGRVAVFFPPNPVQPLARTYTTHGLGVAEGTTIVDGDGDGVPDPYDNCVDLPNPRQTDADGDGFGNRCDADLDDDRLVTSLDLDGVRACETADLTAHAPIWEPEELGGSLYPPNPCDEYPPESCPYNLASGCAGADLDDDGIVTAADADLAAALVDLPPGPSAFEPSTLPCDAGRCDDGDPCTDDRCTPAGCEHFQTACDDGDACTIDVCESGTGACLHPPLACDDGDACTTDFCRPATGACESVLSEEARACSDGDPCTVDACEPSTGACTFSAPACDDGNPCTADACSGRTGECSFTALADGTPCSDGSLCTRTDSCLGGVCEGGDPVACGDGSVCTTDGCDPDTGLCRFLEDGCDDGNPCTLDGCDPDGVTCSHAPLRAEAPTNLRFVDPVTLTWDPDPGVEHSNVYRGSIPAGGFRGYDHVCYDSADLAGDGASSSRDPSAPSPGSAYYYVVSGEIACDESPPGQDSEGNARPTAAACLTPP